MTHLAAVLVPLGIAAALVPLRAGFATVGTRADGWLASVSAGW